MSEMVRESLEAAARAICFARGRHCHENHVCDPCPQKCRFWFLYNEAAKAGTIAFLRTMPDFDLRLLADAVDATEPPAAQQPLRQPT